MSRIACMVQFKTPEMKTGVISSMRSGRQRCVSVTFDTCRMFVRHLSNNRVTGVESSECDSEAISLR